MNRNLGMKTADGTGAATCRHCGTPFRATGNAGYCCAGCEYVAGLLEADGLTRFYDLKGARRIPPVGAGVFDGGGDDALADAVAAAEAGDGGPLASATFALDGLSCIACVWLVEAVFQRTPGAGEIRIDARSGRAELTWRREACDVGAFAGEIRALGYRLRPEDGNAGEADAPSATRELGGRIGLCAFFLMNTMLFTLPGYFGMGGGFFLAPLFQMLGALFATLSLVVGGGYFIRRAWRAVRARTLHIDLPIALGVLAAYGGSLAGWATGYGGLLYFDFVATFVFLMLVGRWLQEYALERNRAHLRRRSGGPGHVTLCGGASDGARLPAEAVERGMTYTVAPGALNPVAADLAGPDATLSLEWINGEAGPVVWPAGRTVPAGAANSGVEALRLQAREDWADGLLARLLRRPPDSFRNERLQTVLKYYLAAVMATALLGGMAWLALSGDWVRAGQVLISVLVVSCPCALGVALPVCDEFAQARLRRRGLFVRSGDLWARLRRVATVVFDKTGTLTLENPGLVNPSALRALAPDAADALRRLTAENPHPVARTLRAEVLRLHGNGPRAAPETSAAALHESTGRGVRWTDARGRRWTLGRPEWAAAVDRMPADGAHTVLRREGRLIAAFDFREDVREDARAVVGAFARRGLGTVILSGDARERVRRVAAGLGLPTAAARSRLDPDAKAAWIDRHAPGAALMVGDGANDSLAFDRAVCRGAPVADRSPVSGAADFFFFGKSLRCLEALFTTAVRRRRTVAAVFAFAVAYNVAAVAVCLAGAMHPLLAAILMPLSSLGTLAIAWVGLGARFAEAGSSA